MKSFLNSLRLTVWTAQFIWGALSFLVVAAGGTTAGVLAIGQNLLREYGPLAWFGVGLVAAMMTALTIFLLRRAQLAAAQAEAHRALLAKSTRINPLKSSFDGEIIYLPDLYLPGKQLHSRKHFRNCRFVGPGSIALMGGTFFGTGFYDSGDVLVVPRGASVSGIVVLENCTLEGCEFYRVTILVGPDQVSAIRQVPGVRVAV
ncbi:hypothetical protein [Burkholderia gladioli]|uniref:hypothetical protein n=1 Tax=Burkholderia gladioli TaxID=28095 RepID=UPI00163E4B86|nr:hypothetical protein [Burkholderia gladioli]